MSLKNIRVMGCHISKSTSAAGNPAANKNIEIKAKLFPATSRLPEPKGTFKNLTFIKEHFLNHFYEFLKSFVTNQYQILQT
jgi:hypothetical protein